MTLYNLERARKKLDRVAEKVGNRKISSRTFVRMLNREFRSMRVKFFTKPLSKFGKYITVEGYYNGADREDGWVYTLYIIKDPKEKTIKPRRHGLFRELLLVLAHEFRHAYQRKRRKGRTTLRENPKFTHFNKYVRRDVRYLIEYDELDAYAFEAAEELRLLKLTIADLKLSSVYRTMYGTKVKKYAPKHYKKWVRKVYQHLNKKTVKEVNSSAQQ